MKKIRRVLIANRGEIAFRISKTLREMGIESVAIYSEADRESLHRFSCDFAIPLLGKASLETYLNIPKVLDAIRLSGACAVHPGYGFLSENDEFARRVAEETQATFIGPSFETIQLMGDKVRAKNLLRSLNLPTLPGSTAPLTGVAELEVFAKDLGFPLILKAAAGGGGRGMRVVRKISDLEPAFLACTREAKSYFGNEAVFCERYIEKPRHIEFQMLFDQHGNGVHLFERDCTIQRRHQKLIEEAPSSYLSPVTRERLGEIAVRIGKASNYVGAGTIEFICESPDKAYFMEMNTRIQVEHPATEMITGVDLIAEQIRVASGEKLSFTQKDLQIRGHAIEARINAEDPQNQFRPSPGKLESVTLPSGPFVRVDSHLYPGYVIPEFYDSMVAKIIVWGRNRSEAMQRLKRALKETKLEGVSTTILFHLSLLDHPEFISGDYSTRFLEEKGETLVSDWIEQQKIPVHHSEIVQAFGKTLLEKAPPPEASTSAWGIGARYKNLRGDLL